MPETFTLTKTGQDGASDTVTEILTVSGNDIVRATPSVPAAKTGTLTTRTDNDTGTFTMTTGHGFITSDKIDVFWAGGARHGMTATVTGDSVVLDVGVGDNLPAATTPITAMKPTSVTFVVVGNNVIGLGVSSPRSAYIVFVAGGSDITAATYRIATAGLGKSWISGDGTNPLAAVTTATVSCSHDDSTSAQTLKAFAIYN